MVLASLHVMYVRTLVAVIVAIAGVSTTMPAYADSLFFGMAAGPSARPAGDIEIHVKPNTVAAARFFAGARRGAWTIEAAFFGSDMLSRNGDSKRNHLAVGIDARRFTRLNRHAEIYARFGLDYNALGAPTDHPISGFHGPGFHYGLGIQHERPFDGAVIGFYAELGQQRLWLSNSDYKPMSGVFTTVTFGIVLSN